MIHMRKAPYHLRLHADPMYTLQFWQISLANTYHRFLLLICLGIWSLEECCESGEDFVPAAPVQSLAAMKTLPHPKACVLRFAQRLEVGADNRWAVG